MKGVFLLLKIFILSITFTFGQDAEILGCGGFVRSKYKIDFGKIEIKLFTKQGSLKMRTECAPTTGYYFIPLENKGSYVLKISPPEGWTFDPPQYELQFDGKTDLCSLGTDVNFDFKGFSVFGKVVTTGFSKGPQGVTVNLAGPDGIKLEKETEVDGAYSFDSIPPGKYKLTSAHPHLTFEKDSTSFEIKDMNIVLNNEISISGYDVHGKVKSEGNPVPGVTFLLISNQKDVKIPKTCNPVGNQDFKHIQGKILCQQNSDDTGIFRFKGLLPGQYSVIPVYKGKNIVYNVSPDRQEFTLEHGSKELPVNFEVEGFTVQGRVKGLSQASISVNGEIKATSGHDGTFIIQKMKPGSYEFHVLADKFEFDKVKLTISAANPILPDFIPARFQTCGKIQTSGSTPLKIQFKNKDSGSTLQEMVPDPQRFCVYLPAGSYSVSVDSVKYFSPTKIDVTVPQKGSELFTFLEFHGDIQGNLDCPLDKCPGIIVQLRSQETGLVVNEVSGPAFTFSNLDSGLYSLSLLGTAHSYCWKETELKNVHLKNENLKNLLFKQVGYKMVISSTHSTQVEIKGDEKITDVKPMTKNSPLELCVSKAPQSYKVNPVGCHEFDQKSYSFTLGSEIQLNGKSQWFTGSIYSPKKIDDLQVSMNGESKNVVVEEKSSKDGNVVYFVKFLVNPDVEPNVKFTFFSYGFIFEPSEFTYTVGSDCETDKGWNVVAKKSHLIKGKLSMPLEGVEIRIELVGDPEATTYVTTNAAGEYIAGPFVHSSGFLVTPSLSGYAFNPTKDDPYSFNVAQLAKIRVKVAQKLPIVLLSLSGPNSYRQNKVTDADGEMTFDNLEPGDYYLKALLKEFQFQPSAMNIQLKEEETKEVLLEAKRESFSLYGTLSSISGELMSNLLVTAKGTGNCSEYGEEGLSDEFGNFRIWALKSYCNYQISVVNKDDSPELVERTIPASMDVKVETSDMQNVSFIVITPVRRMDVSLRCLTNNDKTLDTLKAHVYSSVNPDTPLHSVSFKGVSYIILPPLVLDPQISYFITFESSLSKYQYEFRMPGTISFMGDSQYAHFEFEFNTQPAPVDQDIGKNSYLAFAMVVLVIVTLANYDRLSVQIKDVVDSYAYRGSAGATASKKNKAKTK